MRRLLALLFALLAVACSSAVMAPTPMSSVDPPESKVAGKVKLDLGPLSDDPVCSKAEGLDDLCVQGLRTAMEQALRSVIDAQFDGSGTDYLAKFRFAQLSHAEVDGEVEITFGWQFLLVSKGDEPVLMLNERTTGPETVKPGADPEQAVGAALSAVLDGIAEPMAAAEL
ncbi:MAG: hypothetical protein JRI23_25880 [Deltaproteobacteria bacterium]|jgi:hypothetical protein|nr:hypothetical protein [Deltaproteobacteria bacterium]MBW2535458.1 hypothetical protein [Deltaproteobacteria bacterium]